jgi:hypothetical protein
MNVNLISEISFTKLIQGTLLFLSLTFASLTTHSQELDVNLIQLDLGREYGVFSKSPAVLRAVSVNPLNSQPKTALLFFVGWPGQLWLPEKIDPQIFVTRAKKSGFYALQKIDFFPSKNINFVLVDCPTDQWGSSQRSPEPTGCSDSFRSSEQHGKDIAVLINYLKEKQGIEKIYIMGHSYGSMSSRWLAIQLGSQIQGSIHSASMSRSAPGRFFDYGSSVSKIDMSKASAPWIFLHNREDKCFNTLYTAAQSSAGSKLITVRGGSPEGDPCGAGHYHSYQGRELDALGAVAKWIQTGEMSEFVGEP